MKLFKAQSAMEYLMTYGWAILIIAIVLAALFSLGIFSSTSFLGTTCIPLQGYICNTPLLHNGQFTATVGQVTGTQWTSANIIFVEAGAPTPTTATFSTATSGTNCATVVPTGLAVGQYVSFSVLNAISSAGVCTPLPSTPGGSVAGEMWAEYSTSSASNLISEIATVTLKAS